MVVATTHQLGMRTKMLWIRTAYTNGSCNHSPPVHENKEVVDQDSIYKLLRGRYPSTKERSMQSDQWEVLTKRRNVC